ncbi:MAG: TetR/AcrR family transcriptional regulator [Candidatus Binataceae bacterium]
MDILEGKPGTKRPVIIRAATSLFAKRGVDATSMRDIAEAAGVREAAIYRHFASKDEMSREIFTSWYGWYSRQLQEIARGPGAAKEKVYGAARVELSAAAEHTEAFTYFCENEARFIRSLPAGVPRARAVFTELITQGQERREVKAGDAGLLADMLSGALCAVALSSVRRRRRGDLNKQLDLVAEACWAMLAA